MYLDIRSRNLASDVIPMIYTFTCIYIYIYIHTYIFIYIFMYITASRPCECATSRTALHPESQLLSTLISLLAPSRSLMASHALHYSLHSPLSHLPLPLLFFCCCCGAYLRSRNFTIIIIFFPYWWLSYKNTFLSLTQLHTTTPRCTHLQNPRYPKLCRLVVAGPTPAIPPPRPAPVGSAAGRSRSREPSPSFK